MATVTLTIDGQQVEAPEGSSILNAADAAGIYIPRLCYHPDLGPVDRMSWKDAVNQVQNRIEGGEPAAENGEEAHCGLCLVAIADRSEPVRSCDTAIQAGLVVITDTDDVKRRRQQALANLLADHPHACLTCAQKEGCSRTDCSSNVPVEERCCVLLGRCELEKVADYIGIPGNTRKYVPDNRARTDSDPLYLRDYELCIGCLRCVRICESLQGKEILATTWKDDRAWVGTTTGVGLIEAECRFCGACVEICPTGALRDKEGVPAVRHDSLLPCISHCPAGINIPRYLKAVAEGRYREALEIIRASVPFPGILGYVCFHPCEDTCRRGEIDQPVAICDLKRFVADSEVDALSDLIQTRPATGRKVSVIGTGPSGLTAAFYLSVLGHKVSLYDRESEPGGMMRYGIPDYRLPPDVLDREIRILSRLNVAFNMNHRFETDDPVEELRTAGADAVLVAIGASVSKTLPLENADLEGVQTALDFLRSAKSTGQNRLSGTVVVIGGGNVAIDAAMTALRKGADEVRLICLESKDEMPAHAWEIAQAEEEGVLIDPSWGPMRYISNDGRLAGVELRKCTGVFDQQGRFAPQYDEAESHLVETDHVIVAVGQRVDPLFPKSEGSLPQRPDSTFQVNDEFNIGRDGVFAAGDAVRGPSSVIDAIAEGRRVAEVIDRFLGGPGLPVSEIPSPKTQGQEAAVPYQNFMQSRVQAEQADPRVRTAGFSLIASTLSEAEAICEAQRCLKCYLRQGISPVILPPERWQPLNQDSVSLVPASEGVIQLFDRDKKLQRISGTPDMRQSLRECLDEPGEAEWFLWEEDPMYTKRESELIQQYVQQHGELPGGGGGDDLDDLF